ncbi:MAG: hypothetical protein ACRBBP_02225 [Bdellovibrionales bacterium]
MNNVNKTILFSSVAILISGCGLARDNNLPETSEPIEVQAAETAATLTSLTKTNSADTCPELAEYYVCGEQVEDEDVVSVEVEIQEDRNENLFFVDNGIDPENSDLENLVSEIIYDNGDGLSLDGSVQDRSFSTRRDGDVVLGYSASCGADSVTTHITTDSSALKTTYTKVDEESIEVKSYSLDEEGQVAESVLNCIKAEKPASSLLSRLKFW